MRQWLAQFKISENLRCRSSLPPFWRKKVENDPALAAFKQKAMQLDQQLREEARAWPARAPSDLAPAVLRALPSAGSGQAASAAPTECVRRWIPVATAAVLVVLALGWVFRNSSPGDERAVAPAGRSPSPESLAGPIPLSAALLANIGLQPPATIEDPLSNQLAAAKEDARAAARFLVASLP